MYSEVLKTKIKLAEVHYLNCTQVIFKSLKLREFYRAENVLLSFLFLVIEGTRGPSDEQYYIMCNLMKSSFDYLEEMYAKLHDIYLDEHENFINFITTKANGHFKKELKSLVDILLVSTPYSPNGELQNCLKLLK